MSKMPPKYGTWLIKLSTLEGTTLLEEYKGYSDKARGRMKEIAEKFWQEKIGSDWRNEKKQKKFGQFMCAIKP